MNAAFPARWDLDVVLADGGTVHIRPILPSDAETYLRFFHRLSRETRFYRFFSPKSRLSDDEVRFFTTVDFTSRLALVALVGGEIVAVARYDRLDDREVGPHGPDAEVAFTIDDLHQGRGLGTLMLEYLAAAGRENGIGRFVAQTLPDNRRMIRVFHDAGYQTADRFTDGVIEVEFPIATTQAARDAVERREHRAEARSVERILRPASVAVIGASATPGSTGHRLFTHLLAGGFVGPVYPVNPNVDHVASVPAHPDVASVPGPVDLAVVATPAEAVAGVVAECAEAGVKGLVIVADGFAETGPPGAALEREVLEVARRGGLRVMGPSSMGVINTALGLHATYVPVHPPRGRLGILSQSGAIGMALLDRAASRQIGVSSFAAVGDKVDVSGNDLLQFWEDDPDTDVVLLHLESFGNPRKFARIARRVAASTPVVVVTSGRGATGDGRALVADGEAAVDALLAQAGVIRATTIGEAFDVASLLLDQPLPGGDRVAVVANARGAGVLAVDAVVDAGLRAADLRPAPSVDDPSPWVGPPVPGVVALPVLAEPRRYTEVLRALADDEGVDIVLVVVTPPIGGDVEAIGEAIRDGAGALGRTCVVTHLSAGPAPSTLALASGLERLPVFDEPASAAEALARVVRHAGWRRRGGAPLPDPDRIDRDAARRVIDEALDGVDDGTDVVLGPALARRLVAAYGIVGDRDVEPTGLAEVPVAVGLVADDLFGPLVSFAFTGAVAELVGGPSYRLVPLTAGDAADLVRSSPLSPLLVGHGRGPAVAVDRLEDVLVRVGVMADDLAEVATLELSPVVVGPDSIVLGGVVVVLRRPEPGLPDLVRRLRT